MEKLLLKVNLLKNKFTQNAKRVLKNDDGDQIANRPGVIHGCLSPSGTRSVRVFW